MFYCTTSEEMIDDNCLDIHAKIGTMIGRKNVNIVIKY